MKKLFLGFFVILALGLNAQIEQGKLMIGGAFNFSTQSAKRTAPIAVDVDKQLDFTLMPQAGYALAENLVVGLGVGYQYSKKTLVDVFNIAGKTYDQEISTGLFAIGPFARYYKQTGDKAFAFAELELPIGMGSQNSLRPNAIGTGVEDADPTDLFMFGVNLSIGFNYFLNDNCAIEAKWAGLQYLSINQTLVNGDVDPNTGNTVDKKITNSTFGLKADMTAIFLGLKVFM